MEEKTKNILRNYVLPGVLVLALVLVGWWGLEQRALAADYKNITESMYRRAYGDLSDSLYDMESTLAKLLAVNSPAQRVLLLDELWRLSGGAVYPLRLALVPGIGSIVLRQKLMQFRQLQAVRR